MPIRIQNYFAVLPVLLVLLCQAQSATGAYQFVRSFGQPGSGNGQFAGPDNIAVDSSGNVYVSDEVNSRVQVFDNNGTYLRQFGSTGTANGQFRFPDALTLDSTGNVWVVDRGNNRVQEFTTNGEFIMKFGTPGSANGQFGSPGGIDIDSFGHIWVSDSDAFGNFRIHEFSSNGVYMAKFAVAPAADFAVDPAGNVWVADYDRVQEFTSSGSLINEIGEFGYGNGQFNRLSGVEVDLLGNIWVADGQNGRIQKLSGTGEYITQFGYGQMAAPKDVAVDSFGNVWVSDSDNSRILEFSNVAPEPSSEVLAALAFGALMGWRYRGRARERILRRLDAATIPSYRGRADDRSGLLLASRPSIGP
jgi:streptogramin lyase